MVKLQKNHNFRHPTLRSQHIQLQSGYPERSMFVLQRLRRALGKTRPHIGVICAYNNKNAGMYSVDLAADQFFRDIGVDFDLIVVQFRGAAREKRYGRLKFVPMRGWDMFCKYDLIVYWGDFLNSPAYGAKDFANREQKYHGVSEPEPRLRSWREKMLGDPRRTTPSLSVSNNFQGLPSAAEAPAYLGEAYTERFVALYPRDPLSTRKLKSIAPSAKVQQGIDAAFLLDHARLGIKTDPCRDRTFCTFFGRSEIGGMNALVADLERRTGLKAVPVGNWFKCRWKHADRQFGEMIGNMARANFILTDTYHLCVNALNLGVPVVAVGHQTDEQAGTLGDHKKKVLFEMFGLENNYITTLRGEVHQEFHDQVVEAVTRVLNAAPGQVDALRTRISRYRNLLSETVCDALVKKG